MNTETPNYDDDSLSLADCMEIPGILYENLKEEVRDFFSRHHVFVMNTITAVNACLCVRTDLGEIDRSSFVDHLPGFRD